MKVKKYRLFFVFILIFMVILFLGICFGINNDEPYLSPYPDGKNFAFTVTDDAHNQTVEKIKPIYDLLYNLGLRTTIAVYVKEATQVNGLPDVLGYHDTGGDTLQQRDYLAFIQKLHKRGFEISIHTVSAGNDIREVTIAGYEEYKRIFGEYPKINIMHSHNLENIYWGKNVTQNYFLRKMINMFYPKIPYSGEDQGSPFFCGDILKDKTKYVRMWGTWDINTLKFNPSMPYHDPKKPYVNYWFSLSEGHTASVFNKLLRDQNIEKLTREKGASIVYTHFSSGFIKKSGNGEYILNPVTKTQLMKLAEQKDGWFVPVTILLDRLLAMKNVSLFNVERGLVIVNSNSYPVEGITLIVSPGTILYDSYGNTYSTNSEGEIVINKLGPNESATLFKHSNSDFLRKAYPDRWEYFNLVLKRSIVWIFSHK